MTTQIVDMNTVTSVTHNGVNVTEINLDGSVIWPYVAPTGIDVTTAFVPFAGFNVLDSAPDTSANYSVSEIQFNASGSVRIYIGHKVTVSPTYYNDTPIGAIQLIDAAGTTRLRNWTFHTGNNNNWNTISRNVVSSSTQGNLSESPAQAAVLSYTGIGGGTNNLKFNLATSTGSNDTGAVDGTSSPLYGIMTLGNATTPQSSNTYYVYRETSSALTNSVTFMRSEVITVSAGQRIRIAYIMGNRSAAEGSVQDPNDTLFLGII